MKTSGKWICVAAQDGIPLREGRMVDLGGREIAVFNLGDRVMAVENRCPHRGGPLSDGIVAGGAVVCPLHSWKVCLSTGSVIKPSEAACVSTYPARLEEGRIYLELPVSRGSRIQRPQDVIAPPASRAIEGRTQLEL